MSNKNQGKYVPSVPVLAKITNVAAPVQESVVREEAKAIARELNKESQLKNAVLLCLNLLLTSARYGGIKRETEEEIVAHIKELE